MANFVICVDPDADRRRRFVDAAGRRLPLLPGLVSGTAAAGDLEAAWAAGPHAPVQHVADEHGAALIFGEMITPTGDRLSAATLRTAWHDRSGAAGAADHDGYYAAGVYCPGRHLLVGADLLGVYPVYYYDGGDVALVASSPETFACHPRFAARFHPPGLVGLLLTNGLFENETLLAGVRRLAPGHLLLWQSGAAVKEVAYYRAPLSDRYRDLSFASHLDLLDEAMRRAVARHVPAGRPCTLLLSGGVDSRTVGGYLREAGREAVALTFGVRTDLEVSGARRVARALGLRQRVREFNRARDLDHARLLVDWEHCAAGGSMLVEWGMLEHFAGLPPACVSGLGLDWVLGGHAPTHPELSFESFFRYQNAWGLEPERLRRLLRRDVFADLVPATVERMRQTYAAYADTEPRRAWTFALYHRHRFHIGSEAWRLSFVAWPAFLPADKGLLEIGGGLPPATTADRRAQIELLRTRFPDLARLPLDRNSPDVTPLDPGLRWLLAARLRAPVRRVRRALARRGWPERERRRYYRLFDIDGPGWMAVRRAAEPCRELAYAFFEREALDRLLPPPGTPVPYRDGIRDVAAVKTIIAFALWAQQHLRA